MKPFEHFNFFAVGLGFLLLLTVGVDRVAAGSLSDINDVDYFTGRIESISADSIVVSGETYNFGTGVKYLSSAGLKIKPGMFWVGEIVRVHVNSENQILILRKT